MKKCIAILFMLLVVAFGSNRGHAQEPYYFHTIYSNGLSFVAGRTIKLNHLYQLSRMRQLKLSGTYVHDSYDQGRNRIRANLFFATAQFQYQLIHSNQFFINLTCGGGGYHLQSKDKLNIKHKEWHFNFLAGLQFEYYIAKNTMALTLDYDILYLPWSKIYEFLHVPTAGVTLFFF